MIQFNEVKNKRSWIQMVRIGGLASGMDIDQMVKDLMKAERMPLDKLRQKKQVLEWQRDDYRSMNTLLLGFRSELTNMKLTSTYRARTTTSTNESRVSATASSAAGQASYSISEVSQLASAATRTNASKVSANQTAKIDASKSLYSQKDKFDPSTSFAWSEGAVGSKSFAGDGTKAVFNLELDASVKIKPGEESNMTVKVDGKAYEIVTGVTDPATLTENQVNLSETGILTFKSPVKKDASISVNYITDKAVEKYTFTDATKEYQLNKGGLVSTGLSVKVSVGSTDKTYGLSGTADSEGYIELVGTGSTTGTLGKINLETGRIIFSSEQAKDTKIETTYTQNYSTFNITSQTSKGSVKENFIVEASESLNSLSNRVSSSNVGVSMFYDSFSDRVSLVRTESGDFKAGEGDKLAPDGVTFIPGAGNEIVTDGNFLNQLLKFQNSTESGGQNAKFVINGLTTERNSNTFDMNGVTFTLKQTFNDGVAANVSINNDGNKVFENIKSFVEKYNELIDKINKKTSEDRYRSYQPLTDDQRESLSDKQQEQWEEKAKSGLLRRDPILSSVLSQMRRDFYQPVVNENVSSVYNQLASIGITTTASYLEGGKLEIDEAKLKQAINADPKSVENLFRGDGTTVSGKGIIHRLFDSVNDTMNKLKSRAGNSFTTDQQFALGRELKGINDRIERFDDRLKTVEDRYWSQFTAMEKAIQRSNEQAMFFMQQFGGQ